MSKKIFQSSNYPFQKETYQIIGTCMEVHKTIGRGFLEIVYKDAIQFEFQQRLIPFEREKRYDIQYKEIILSHYFIADFIAFDNIILEVKAQEGVVDEHFKYVINYLAASKCKLGLLVNFGRDSLEYKRVIL
ncbi:MAG: GxxExxY protein [Bacteroidales bacterium]|nr:GxxExxY protein [Bacteroidales bacterium]